MKKLIPLLLILTILTSGCSTSAKTEKTVDKNTKTELISFFDDFQNSYCDLKKIDFIFWQKYSAPKMQQLYIEANGNDVPLMHYLGNDGLNYVKIHDTQSDFDKINSSHFEGNFKESIRLVNVGYSFLNKYLTTTSALKDFIQFRDEAMPSFAGFRDTVPKIEDQLREDYKNFTKDHSDLISASDEVSLGIDNICTTLMPELVQNELRDIPYTKDSQSLTKIDLNIWSPTQTASIKINKEQSYPRSNTGAMNIYGTTSDNCYKIEVNTVNITAGVSDKYTLNNYKRGDTKFSYGAREDWNNLGIGENQYTFIANCDGGQKVQDKITINISTPPSVINNTDYTYQYNPPLNNTYPIMNTNNAIETKIDGEFNGWEGETIFKMMNGTIWQQASYAYKYHYAYMPKVLIYMKDGSYYMKVDGVDDSIRVTRLN